MNQTQARYPRYLRRVLRAIELFQPYELKVDTLSSTAHFVHSRDGVSLYVDSALCLVESEWAEHLPTNFRGLVVPDRKFLVWWDDFEGEQVECLTAGSPMTARLFAYAPYDARCAELDPQTLKPPPWHCDP